MRRSLFGCVRHIFLEGVSISPSNHASQFSQTLWGAFKQLLLYRVSAGKQARSLVKCSHKKGWKIYGKVLFDIPCIFIQGACSWQTFSMLPATSRASSGADRSRNAMLARSYDGLRRTRCWLLRLSAYLLWFHEERTRRSSRDAFKNE